MEPVVIHCGHRGPEQRVEKKKEKKTHTKMVLASGDKRQNNVKQKSENVGLLCMELLQYSPKMNPLSLELLSSY